MKKFFTLISILFLALSGAKADDLSYSGTINPGSSTVSSITVTLNGSTQDYTAIQFKVSLPEGYSFVQKSKKYAVKVSTSPLYVNAEDEEDITDHTVTANVNDGKLVIFVGSNSSTEFYAKSGDVLKFYVQANSWVKPGSPDIQISGASLIAKDATKTVDLPDQTITDVTTTTSCALSIPAGWSTCVIPFTPTLPSTVKVYDVNSVSGTTVSLTDASSIGDYKPYVVYNSGDATSLTGTISATYPTGTTKNGKLTGVLTATKITSGYVLQKHESTTAFYNVASEITVPAGKAYLDLSGSAKSGDVLYFEVPTAIQNVVTTADSESIYDLNGMKVTTPHHGVYIKGGKKVVMK